MINKVILLGNLGKDPEARHFESGGMVARFPVATNESYKDKNGEWQQQTEWHDVTVWGPRAERVSQQLHKGSLVYIEGKITHRKWQDREGKDRFSTEIVANVIRNLDKREGSRIQGASSDEEDMPSRPDDHSDGSGGDDLPF